MVLGADFQGLGCAAGPEDAVIAGSEKPRNAIGFGAVDVGNQYEAAIRRAHPALSLLLSTKNQDGHRKRISRRLPLLEDQLTDVLLVRQVLLLLNRNGSLA